MAQLLNVMYVVATCSASPVGQPSTISAQKNESTPVSWQPSQAQKIDDAEGDRQSTDAMEAFFAGKQALQRAVQTAQSVQ